MNELEALEVPATDAPKEEPPRPTFDVLPLSEEVRKALGEMGYEHPTPVQLAVWEPATRGKDAVVQARTGTGKTASFGLPIIDHILKRAIEGVQALVLCPTRELAVQVATEIDRLGKYKGTKSIAIYGGAPMERQVSAIQQGAQLVVGTPGRVLDHIRRGTLRTNNVRLLVLDEADEMLSMGFEKELTAILESLPKPRQTLLFSATVPPDIERISKSKLREPEFVTLSGDHIGALSIQHFTYLVPGDKVGALVQIIESDNPESAVVFCNTRDATESVAAALQARGYDADWLNGDLPQSERESVMSRTKQGQLRFLVATDVAARGIDISHLTHVINFDFPQDAETYVHRTGRTGRAGRTGTAISLVLPQDIGGLYLLRLTYKIRPIERIVPSASELKTRAEADLVTMLAEGLLPKGTHEDDRALARRLLTHDQIEGILAGLLREYLGARPTAKTDAADARRRTVRRATMKTRPEAPPRSPSAPPEAEAPAEAAAQIPPADAAAPIEADARVGSAPRDDFRGGRDRFPRDRPSRDRPGRDRDRPARDRPFGDRPPRDDAPPREHRLREGAAGANFGSNHIAEQAPAPIPAEAPAPVAPPVAFSRPVSPLLSPQQTPPPREDAAAPAPQAPLRAGGPGALRGDRPERDRGEGRIDRRNDRRDERRSPDRKPHGPASEFVAWEPPAEEGDDEPLIPSRAQFAKPGEAAAPKPQESDVGYVELFLGVGRRDSARAQDILRALVENAGVDKEQIRRIRVRDRHAFVAIRQEQAESAIAKLNGNAIAGKASVLVELARERTGSDETSDAATP